MARTSSSPSEPRSASTRRMRAVSGKNGWSTGPKAPNWFVPFGLSPDGETLVVGESANNGGIVTVPRAGGKPAVFLGSPAVEGSAQLSPDGKWLAYQSDEGGRPQVFIRSFPSGRTKFQVSTTDGLRPRWRADGRELYYATGFGGQPLMAVSVEPGGQGLTLGRPQPLFSFSPPSVAHDTPFFPVRPGTGREAVSGDAARCGVELSRP